ncbi:MAG TPA: LysE family transporter [Nitrososphaerales archaeon]|nr:LysE family transporter [Nitrososphaerales archaeon]
MGFLEFGLTVILVSTSGVLSPGPLFFANLLYGSKYGYKAGLKCSYGHTIVELPLILLLAFGALNLEAFPTFKVVISIIGGIALLAFATMQILSVIRKKNQLTIQIKHSPLLIGIIFSALNPFFIIWWLTVGLKMITEALLLASMFGLAFMFLMHIWMDYAWLTSIAHMARKGVSIIGNRYYSFMLLGLSAALIYLGAVFIVEGIRI